MSMENLQAVRRLYQCFGSGDLQGFEQGVSSDLVWNEAENSPYSGGNPYRGFAAVRDAVFAAAMSDYEGFRVDLEQLIDGGEYVIGCGRYRGTSRTTGKVLASQFCHVMHVDSAGKLDRMQQYGDTLQTAEVSGRTRSEEEIRVVQPLI